MLLPSIYTLLSYSTCNALPMNTAFFSKSRHEIDHIIHYARCDTRFYTELEQNKIQTRNLFAGNLVKHPCFDEMRASANGFRIVSASGSRLPAPGSRLPTTDRITRDSFWVGVYPGMTEEMIDYTIRTIRSFANCK